MNHSVLFLDILGISALTTKNNTIAHPKAYQTRDNFPPELQLSIHLLKSFRNCIEYQKNIFGFSVQYMSDSAIIWTTDHIALFEMVPRLMWSLIKCGMLCRGGIANGDAEVCTDRHGNNTFIIGEAVTRAVQLEKSGKGCRIFVDQNFPTHIYHHLTTLCPHIFTPQTSCLTFEIKDEYHWYKKSPASICSKCVTGDYSMSCKNLCIKNLMISTCRIRWSPLFEWNSDSNEGRVHLGATLHILSATIDRFLSINLFEHSPDYFMHIMNNKRKKSVFIKMLREHYKFNSQESRLQYK